MKDTIISHLPADFGWKNQIHWYDTIDSTNLQAKAIAAAGAPHGTVLIADSQSAGRGRLGRSFTSPAQSGIYMSVILRPGCPPAELMHLTCAAAVAMCDAVETALGIRPGVKWINDLVWQRKKLGGILTELSMDAKTGLVDHAVIGIGINCNQRPEDFPPELQPIACSAAMAAGRPIDRSRLAAAMIYELARMDRMLSQQKLIMARYRQDCITVGQEVVVIRGDQRQPGRALSVNDDGSLQVVFADGHTSAVNSGEVSVRGLFGYT